MNRPETIYTITSGTVGCGNVTTVHMTLEGLCHEMNSVLENTSDRFMVREHLNQSIINHNLSSEEKKLDLIGEDEDFTFEKFMEICPSDIGWGWECVLDGREHYLNICFHTWNSKPGVDLPDGYYESRG